MRVSAGCDKTVGILGEAHFDEALVLQVFDIRLSRQLFYDGRDEKRACTVIVEICTRNLSRRLGKIGCRPVFLAPPLGVVHHRASHSEHIAYRRLVEALVKLSVIIFGKIFHHPVIERKQSLLHGESDGKGDKAL